MFNFFKKDDLKEALSKTTDSLFGGVFKNENDRLADEYDFDDMESNLIKSDLGVDLAVEIIDKVRDKKVKLSEFKNSLKNEFTEILSQTTSEKLNFDKNKLNIYFVVGVNGAGKTTLIGKLANKFKKEGNKVLLVAGDTFRAAAEEQLDIWSKRANVDIVREDKAQSAALVFKAIDKARDENYNVVIIDSAGRLQNKFNLIEELKKIKNVILKKKEDAVLETLLVLDGTQGQNGLSQASVFNEAVDITGIVITKLDGTPKGGIIVSVAKNLKIPTKLVSIGEGIDDIKEFDKNEFINAIFD